VACPPSGCSRPAAAELVRGLRGLRDDTAQEVRDRLGADAIVRLDPVVRYFGLESASLFQIRGNGCLAATEQEILFVLWVPRREVRIERTGVTGIETPHWHRGKGSLRRLLRVRFVDPRGEPDAAAFEVRDLDGWLSVLG
jgi:hypothetical protein